MIFLQIFLKGRQHYWIFLLLLFILLYLPSFSFLPSASKGIIPNKTNQKMCIYTLFLLLWKKEGRIYHRSWPANEEFCNHFSELKVLYLGIIKEFLHSKIWFMFFHIKFYQLILLFLLFWKWSHIIIYSRDQNISKWIYETVYGTKINCNHYFIICIYRSLKPNWDIAWL